LQTICLGWPWTMILLISVSQVARITVLSHWCPTEQLLCNVKKIFFFLWAWGLKSGLHACKAGTLPLKSHLQSILV
jgi:hypothetical protein